VEGQRPTGECEDGEEDTSEEGEEKEGDEGSSEDEDEEGSDESGDDEDGAKVGFRLMCCKVDLMRACSLDRVAVASPRHICFGML
jgi:hypothetical protein